MGAAPGTLAPGDGGTASPAQKLELYANIRPAVLYPGLIDASPLKPEVVDGLDLVVVRELTGGFILVPRRGKLWMMRSRL